ncbi:MAG: outer membrane protein assembly factor BamA [Gemmataceae bacterium]|nr:outer membrane protein assembly factor BamA [Gemmataceae bacterium]
MSKSVRSMAVSALLLLAALCPAQTPTDKVVAEVVVRNNKLVATNQILNSIKTRVDKPYNHATVQGDVSALMATRSFSDVRASYAPTADGKVVVTFDVVELPSVVTDIKFEGAKHAKNDELLTLTGLQRGVPLNPVANKMAVHAIQRYYQEKGRIYAHVDLIEGGNSGDSKVVFRITEGPEVKVSSVQFTGQTGEFATAERLRTKTETSRAFLGSIGGTYNPGLVELDVMKLEEYYRTFGYHDVKIGREIIPSEDCRTVKVVFHIHEGPRYRVKDVQLVGASTFPEDRVRSVTRMKAGELYDQNVIKADLKNIGDLYGYSGRKVTPREEIIYSGPGEVTVQYTMQERPPDRVGRVIVAGNDVTRQNVILRQVPVYPGQVLEYPALAQAERNLSRLGIFEMDPEKGQRPTVTVLDPFNDNPIKDVLVQVQETQTGSLLFSVGVNSDAGLQGSVVLNEKNFDITRWPTSWDDLFSGRAFRGAGQEFRLEAVPGQRFQRYTASFREPSLFDSLYSLGTSAYFYQRGYAEYNEQRIGGRVTLGRRLNSLWSANGTLRLENVDIYDVPDYYPPEITQYRGSHFLGGVRASLNRDSRDSYLRPTEGSNFEIGYEQCFGDYNFPLFNIEFSKFFTLYQRPDGSGRQVLALRSQANFSTTDAPIYERFYAGGFRSLRGFEFRGVGPFTQGLNTGGTFSFLNSAEYQIPVVASDQFYVVGFVDSGCVESKVQIENYRVTAGLGMRISVPALGPLPIALDFGVPIVKGPDDRKQVFSFWMGYFY